jgi:membrane protein
MPQRNGNGNGPSAGTAQDAPIAELVKRLSDQTSTLVRQEMELARVEMTEKGKRLGAGAGMLGAAGFVGWFAFGALTAAAVLALATAVDGWLSALIVAGVYFALAGVLALIGKAKVKAAGPPVPEQAIETTKQDVAVAKARAQEGRR